MYASTVDQTKVDFVVKTVQEEFNKFYGKDLILHKLLNSINAEVSYLSNQDMANLDKELPRGLNIGNRIYVQVPEEATDKELCMEYYYVLSHELLHVISTYYLHKESANHDSNMWVNWAFTNNKKMSDSLEFFIYNSIGINCNFFSRS